MPTEKLDEVMLQIEDCRFRSNRYPLQTGLTVFSLLETALGNQGIYELEIDRSRPGRPRVARLDGHEDVSGGPSWEPHLNGVPMYDDFERELGPGDTVRGVHTKDPFPPEG